METFRADIDAANDNRTQRRWKMVITVLAVLIVVGSLGYMKAKSYLFDGLPALPTKETMWEMNLQPNMTLVDSKNTTIGHRGPYVGRPLKLNDMPRHLPGAFLAIEDERFYDHAGIDRKAILRAFFENTKSGKTVQGGSTLTQQLVKNMLLTSDKNYRRKFQEMWLAYEMEAVLSKPEILELYLNRISLGNRTFGVEAASQRYFGKSATDINLSEAAMLAALPKAPSRFDPTRNYDGAWARGKLVLQRMLANNMITITELSQAETNPPVLKEGADVAVDPNAIGHFFDYTDERSQELIGHKIKDLIVTTTIDPELQAAAQAALETALKKQGKSRKVTEGAIVLIENSTGEIKAMVGGRDYKASKFNRAAQALRQPGSSFKAFVYAAALEEGFTPGTVRVDQQVTIAGWSPENYTKRYRGPMTIREALKHSINTVAAQVGAEIGPTKVSEIAKRFGIRSPLRAHYSISLGSSEVTLVELTGAYMVFANGGLKRTPYFIKQVKNTGGEGLYKYIDRTPERVYAQSHADQMVDMLRDAVVSGTARGAQIGKREVAGKTGTSQDHRDAWFVGFSADYTAGVWMGNDDNSSMYKVTGGLLPADVWSDLMRTVHKGKKYRPLLQAPNNTDDARERRRMDFYASMVQELLDERNLAAGIDIPIISDPPNPEASNNTLPNSAGGNF